MTTYNQVLEDGTEVAADDEVVEAVAAEETSAPKKSRKKAVDAE